MTQAHLGTIRKPLTVLILTIVTLGIYGLIYYYKTFEELKMYRGEGWSGALCLIIVIVSIIIPIGIAIPFLIPAYVGRAFEKSGQQKPITGLSGFWIFIPFIGGIIWLFAVQGKLNEFWASQGVTAG